MCKTNDENCNCANWRFYHIYLVVSTTVGLVAFVVACVGVGIYIPTNSYYQSYIKTLCYILDHEYDICQQQTDTDRDYCYTDFWSVEFRVAGTLHQENIFSTITHKYNSPLEALQKLNNYVDNTNHSCYYHYVRFTDVQWNRPPSPSPYFIMIVAGFGLVAIYLTIMVICCVYQHRRGEFELI